MADLVEPQKVDIAYETDEPVLYEVSDGVAWLTMNRPAFNNAQNGQMTYALDDLFNRAVQDDAVKCIVLAGTGKHFSAGHDIGTPGRDLHREFDKRLMLARTPTSRPPNCSTPASRNSTWACASAGARRPSRPSRWFRAPASPADSCWPGCAT